MEPLDPKAELMAYVNARLPALRDPGKCWEWTGTKAGNGYGRAIIKYKRHAAHRLVYELLVGPIPSGLELCHHCDNRPCCNPVHLFPGTRSDNMRDASNKRRLHAQISPETMPRGEQHGSSKLTSEQVAKIRAARAAKKRYKRWGATALAKEFGVDESTIRRVARGVLWKCLPVIDGKAGGT